MNSLFISCPLFVALLALVSANCITYEKMPYGFNRCTTNFKPLQTDVSEADMIKLARKDGADGFTYQPNLRFGRVLASPYDRSCQSPADQSWPLYLSKIPYSKMPYGFNRCPISEGPLRRDVTEDDMAQEMTLKGADGFMYQSSLRYGKVLTKPYDRSCQSPSSQSWPLFLKTIQYKRMPYGFNGCNAQFSRNYVDVTQEFMEKLANENGADGYSYQPTLRYGAYLTKPYDRSCQSPADQSWPLYLSVQ